MTDMKTKSETIENIHRRISTSMELKSLARNEGSYAKDRGNVRLNSLCSDSRRVTPGAAFFALPGMRTNGNEHLKEAIERGARVVITDSEHDNLPSHVVKVKVDDARIALAKFSKRYHGNPDELLNLVGITGTNGKTTVTSLTRHLLEEPGRPVGLIGTVKYHLGDRELPSYRTTPEAADLYPLLKSMLVGGCSEAVMEVSSHGIHQSRVAGLRLEIAAFLNLSRDHLDYHKSMEAYFKEKNI
jgi:UDP-N-acetylmuramoyl-L-alanyl-D-glutamate--2,6-diaminopimelate ligase